MATIGQRLLATLMDNTQRLLLSFVEQQLCCGGAMLDLLLVPIAIGIIVCLLLILPWVLIAGYAIFSALGVLIVTVGLLFGVRSTDGPLISNFNVHLINLILLGVGYTVLRWVRPDPAGLPKELQFLAQFLPAPVQSRRADGSVDLKGLDGELRRTQPGSLFKTQRARFDAWRYKKAADELKASAEETAAKAEVARAARALNEAQEKLKAAKRGDRS